MFLFLIKPNFYFENFNLDTCRENIFWKFIFKRWKINEDSNFAIDLLFIDNRNILGILTWFRTYNALEIIFEHTVRTNNFNFFVALGQVSNFPGLLSSCKCQVSKAKTVVNKIVVGTTGIICTYFHTPIHIRGKFCGMKFSFRRTYRFLPRKMLSKDWNHHMHAIVAGWLQRRRRRHRRCSSRRGRAQLIQWGAPARQEGRGPARCSCSPRRTLSVDIRASSSSGHILSYMYYCPVRPSTS